MSPRTLFPEFIVRAGRDEFRSGGRGEIWSIFVSRTVSGGADEVGRATTSAVVRSIVLVIVSDLLVTAVIYVRG